jgi:deferrochelatase/peroxidase EfeB
MGRPADAELGNQQRHTQYQYTDNIDDQKGCTTILTSHVRKSPDITETHGRTHSGGQGT